MGCEQSIPVIANTSQQFQHGNASSQLQHPFGKWFHQNMTSSMILDLLPNGRYNLLMTTFAGMMMQTCGAYVFQGNAFYMREYPSSVTSGWVVTSFTGSQIVFFNQQFGFVPYVRQQFYNANLQGNPAGFSFAPHPLNSSNNGVASQVLEGINNSGVLESVGEALGNMLQDMVFEM